MGENIELRDFIENELIDIAEGIKKANTRLMDRKNDQWEVFSLRQNKGDSAKIPGIKFDVAVTAANKSKGKMGLMVALVNIGGGASTERSAESGMTHRIQFEIGINSEWK